MFIRSRIALLLAAAAATLVGCTNHPPGESSERLQSLQQGRPFARPAHDRRFPPLPENPTPDDLVRYAELTNADLEKSYWDWRSAIEQIPQDGTQTTTLNLSAGTSITRGRASLGSSTLSLSNDPMTDIKWPGKLDAAARQALENARATGRRFFKAKYDLRNKMLSAYYDYALNAELIRLEERNEQLLKTIAMTTAARNSAGTAGQQDVLKANNEVDLSHNEAANMQSQLASQRAAINALLNRPIDAPLPTPTELPPERYIAYDDAELFDLAAQRNPELVALSDEIRARQEGIRLAKLQYVPDLNFSAGTDLMGITQSILGQATLPIFRYEALNAAIAQAEANLRASDAMRHQAGNNLAAQIIADVTSIRDVDRQLDLFGHTILPRTRQIEAISRSAYETGHSSLLDLLGSQRSLLVIERLLSNLKIAREKRLVDLEAATTIDLSRRDPASAVAETP